MVNVKFGSNLLEQNFESIALTFNNSIYNGIISSYLNSFFDLSEAVNIIAQPNLLNTRAASIFDHVNLTPARAASIFDNVNLTPARAASIFDHVNLTPARGASIFDNVNLALARAASIFDNANLTPARAITIYNHPNLTITRLNSIFTHVNLSEARRVSIMHALNQIGGKTPTLSGTWETSPTSLTNITDSSNITSVSGSVFAAGGSPTSEGFINIDIGTIVNVKLITAQWSATLMGGGGGHLANVILQTSTDGTTWVDRASGQSFNGNITLNLSIRFVRLRVSVSPGSFPIDWARNTLNSCHFILG